MSRRQPDGSRTKYSRGATAEAPVTDQDRARKAAIDYLTSEALEPCGGGHLSLEAAGLQNAFHNRMKVQRAVQDMRDSGRAAGIALEAVKKHGAASGGASACAPG